MPPEPEGFETWWKLHGRFLHGRDATVKDIARDGWQAALAQAAQVAEAKQFGWPDPHRAKDAEHYNQNVCVRNGTARQIAEAIRRLGGRG